jgi:hypothetical protein
MRTTGINVPEGGFKYHGVAFDAPSLAGRSIDWITARVGEVGHLHIAPRRPEALNKRAYASSDLIFELSNGLQRRRANQSGSRRI